MLRIPRPVWLLGWVSLATDAASEAIYALLPFFLTQVLGATAVSLGIVEGAAEAANSLLKIVSGRIADRSRGKRWLVLIGYGVSSFVRPFIAIASTWTHVFTIRVIDRVGKGVRGAPRDAMLAAWASSTMRGRVYGFHRGMDHLGAVVGPALATLFLVFYPGEYRTLFALTIVPGAIAVGWLVYAIVYGGFAVSSALSALLAWFLVYGFYFGFAEGTEKALVADLAPASRRGFAFGIYNAVQGVGALAASVLFGVIWKVYGAPVAFGVGAALALVATALLFVVVPRATES